MKNRESSYLLSFLGEGKCVNLPAMVANLAREYYNLLLLHGEKNRVSSKRARLNTVDFSVFARNRLRVSVSEGPKFFSTSV